MAIVSVAALSSCRIPEIAQRPENTNVPESFKDSNDSLNSAKIDWNVFFTDSNLVALIDTALLHNQELNVIAQEIKIAESEVMTRKGEYLPFVDVGAGAGVEKVGRYTSQGANDANTEIKPGQEFPEPLPDFMLVANTTWEVDIWHKLRNARDAAAARYLASVEGKNFLVTQLVSEIASSYYELLALDQKLEILKSNIEILNNALEVVKLQKQSAKTTELAVKRFEAEVLKNKSHQFDVEQEIVEMENRINFLVGRFPQRVVRDTIGINSPMPDTIYAGIPSQLLENRPDIRLAALELEASKLDVKVARAEFYPSLRLTAGLGVQSFNPAYLASMPESMLYSLAGDLMMPLINRKAIKARFYGANARQTQAVYEYEMAILKGYIEVANRISKIDNLNKSYDLKAQQVEVLVESIDISNKLFQSARADYMEVLLTQREALESRFELVETNKELRIALIEMYKALGGGWN